MNISPNLLSKSVPYVKKIALPLLLAIPAFSLTKCASPDTDTVRDEVLIQSLPENNTPKATATNKNFTPTFTELFDYQQAQNAEHNRIHHKINANSPASTMTYEEFLEKLPK